MVRNYEKLVRNMAINIVINFSIKVYICKSTTQEQNYYRDLFESFIVVVVILQFIFGCLNMLMQRFMCELASLFIGIKY